ncbi:uncharacterized protein LOC143461074 [Clavelina lepadiformis]|uniref:Uncharacterized protein n=1 Tax=Clavelina lepadiformis TaxID=159417 RepID=A0ABP0GFH2_CLALP
MPLHSRYRPPQHKTCDGYSICIAITGVLVFSSALATVIDGFIFGRPGIPALNFEATTCQAVNYLSVEERSCECGGVTNDSPYCKSSFLCVQVIVNYNVTGVNGTYTMTGVVHEHESVAYSIHEDCSLNICKQDRRANGLKVQKFIKDYGTSGQRYECYYDRRQPNTVIIERRYTLTIILISLIVPGGVFFLSVIALVILCIFAKKRNFPDPPSISTYRGYLNPSVVGDNGRQVLNISGRQRGLPGYDESETYRRQEDPRPPTRDSHLV